MCCYMGCVCLQGSWQGLWPEYFFTHLMEAYMHLILINILMLITLAILYGPFGKIKARSRGSPSISDDINDMLGWTNQVGGSSVCGG